MTPPVHFPTSRSVGIKRPQEAGGIAKEPRSRDTVRGDRYYAFSPDLNTVRERRLWGEELFRNTTAVHTSKGANLSPGSL